LDLLRDWIQEFGFGNGGGIQVSPKIMEKANISGKALDRLARWWYITDKFE